MLDFNADGEENEACVRASIRSADGLEEASATNDADHVDAPRESVFMVETTFMLEMHGNKST